MTVLKYFLKQLPIQRGYIVTIQDMFGLRFTVKVDSVSWLL